MLGLIAALLITAVSGCSQGDGHPSDASPIVSADSERGKRAIAETDAFCQLRKAQEAKAYARAKKRRRTLPENESSKVGEIASQVLQPHKRNQP